MMRPFFLCLLLTGCATGDGALLRWATAPGTPHEYQASIENTLPLNVKGLVLTHGINVLTDPNLRKEVKNALMSFELPPANATASIGVIEDHLRVVMIGTIPEYESPPKNKMEKSLRELTEARNGELLLVGDMDRSGKLLSFYLRPNQSVVMSLAFSLPKNEVKIGDSWSIPINLIQIPTNYFPDKINRVNKVFLEEISEQDNGQSIAKLFYVITEEVVGKYKFSYSDEVVASEITMSLLAYAEFNLDLGQWHKFTGITYYSSEGHPGGKGLKLYALLPKEREVAVSASPLNPLMLQ